MAIETQVIREGEVWVKGNKTDAEFQRFIVRERDLGDGARSVEYYHSQFGKWFELPAELERKIAWDAVKINSK